MKKFKHLLAIGAISILSTAALNSCNKTGFKVGLLCLHGQTSTYDNNFINGFLSAIDKLKQEGVINGDEYEIRTDVGEDYNEIYTAAKEWAEDGYSLVFADSFGHQYGLIDVATEYPNTEFSHATGTTAFINPQLKNYHNAFASIYKGRYLAGVAAGWKMIEDIQANKYTLEDAKVGYVGAWPYAEVISGYTSFYLGVCTAFDETYGDMNHRPPMYVKYTFSWYDYAAEKEAAQSLITQNGCKLLSGHADSMGVPQVCSAYSIPNVTYNISTFNKTPNSYLYGCKINWEPYFELIIRATKEKYDNKAESANIPTDFSGDLDVDENKGSVQMLEFGSIASDNIKNKVAIAKDNLINKKTFVFDTSKFTVSLSNNQSYMVYNVEFEDPNVTEHGKVKNYIANVIDDPDYYADTPVVAEYEDIKYINESGYDSQIPYDPTSGKADCLRSAPYFELIIDGITELNRA